MPISTTPTITSRIVLDMKYGKIIRAMPQTNGTTIFCLLPYTKKPRPIEPNSSPQSREDVSNRVLERLTVKLRGRPEALDQPPRARNLSRAGGADTQAVHDPLQRLLDGDGSIIVELNSGYHSSFREVVRALVDLTKKAKVNADVRRLKVVGAVFAAERWRNTIGIELPLGQEPPGISEVRDDSGHKVVQDERSLQ
jgi:hypothetical protein